MLCNLVVENYALISRLEIEFKKGLTIITGETGAGKSILLGAMSLILGKRADTSVLYDKDKKCIVEGTFDITGYGLSDFFTENKLDYDDQTIIRREISAAGKSRAFINDIPVNLESLSELGNKLIDIHSQHQNLDLANSAFQMKVIDSYARADKSIDDYRRYFHDYRVALKAYDNLSEEAAQSRSETDYLNFQFAQLDEAKLKEGEQEELEVEQEKLIHAEEIKTGLSNALMLIQGEGQSVIQQLKDSLSAINRIIRYLHAGSDILMRIDSSYIEIKDIAHEIETLNNQLNYEPGRLESINERLNLIYSLEKKHRVSTVSELIVIREQLKDKISVINSYDLTLSLFQKELTGALEKLKASARELSEIRKKAIPMFEKHVTSMLSEVGIPSAKFTIELMTSAEYSLQGSDTIRFLFSANRNMNAQDISRVASGGEISRLMLCIKSLMIDSTGLPTIIFDEIDTGVSGETAERVGNIIYRMSEKMQIINITHLPQVASKGKYHYLVYKTDEGKATVTRIKLLGSEERIIEIAKMLSGEEITPAALENARVLLGNSSSNLIKPYQT
jgi:DNA repair protein RecN (Recombination protein N)